MAKTKKKTISKLKIIFLVSLVYYLFWLVLAIYFSFKGVNYNFGLSLPASSTKIEYGLSAFKDTIVIGALYTIFYFWFIPLFQILYIIYACVKKKKQTNKVSKIEQN